MTVEFAHLHVHTEYSLLDGLSRIRKLAQKAKQLGMRHIAITDHGTMYGTIEFYKVCTTEGLHPVIGVEAYLTEDIRDWSKPRHEDYTHLLLLASNETGYRNLLKLTTIANTEGVRANKPRIDKNLLARYGEGLIATSSCLGGEIPQLLVKGQYEQACSIARWYQDVLGPEHYYLEIQEHHGVEEDGSPSLQGHVNQALYRMHKELSIPLLATNDLHYVDAQDASTHEILLCVQTASQLATKHFHFDSKEYFLRSPSQMLDLFPDLPEALTNTVRLAEQCEVNPLAYKAKLPVFPVPPGYATQREYLYVLAMQGVKERFGEMTDEIKRRIDYEIDVLDLKGFVPYILIEGDFVQFARSKNIRCSARGSAAGSLLAYVLGITNVDPLRYQLPFERFFTPEREDAPDIDMDFQDNRRQEVIDYVTRKYGLDCVAQIVTFNTMAAKNSVKDVARVLGEQQLGDRISRLIPTGPRVTLQGSLAEIRELQQLYETQPVAREILDQALQLESSVRSTGVHPAGVILGNEPLENFVPLRFKDFKDPKQGRITQIEQQFLEELGLIKYDFLGLSNLTILDNTILFIKQNRGEEINLEAIPLDETGNPEQDRKRANAFALLAAGETMGIFQLEGAKMREYIKQLVPNRIEDLTAMVALYRPGPMDSIPDFIDAKHGRKKVVYLDPRLSEWLDESYGIIVYQDQVLFIAVNIAGFSWGKAHKFRKALSKKKVEEVAGYRQDFLQGCIDNGMRPDRAEELFTLIEPFGGYGFNKPHAASYAVVAFYCAYLKANYPAEFMAATMTAEAGDAKKIASAVAECKRLGVEVRGPDINQSEKGFIVEQGGVRFGLLAIKGIGNAPIDAIIDARQEDGPFTSLADFCTRVPPQAVGKGAIETLIKAGALDALGEGQRHVLLASVERAMQYGKSERDAKARGLISLFGEVETVNVLAFQLATKAPAISRKQLLAWEKELISVYLSRHPLSYLSDVFKEQGVQPITDVTAELEKQQVILGGILKDVHLITTKKGDPMCIAQLEDMYGTIATTVFPRLYEETRERWVEDAVVIVRGEVQIRNDEPNLLCSSIAPVQAVEEEINRNRYQIWLTIELSGADEIAVSNDIMKVQDLHRCIQAHPGHDPYEILVSNRYWQVRLTPSNNTLGYSPELHMSLESILGANMVEVKRIE